MLGDASPRALRSALMLGPRVARLPWTGTMVLGALGGVMAPLGAWVTRSMIDALGARHIEVRDVVALAIAGTAAGAATVVISCLSSITTAAAQRRIASHVTGEMYSAVNQLHGLARFEVPQFQDRLRLADGAGLSAGTAVTSALLTGVRTMMAGAGFVYVLLMVWPPMAALLLAVAVPSFVAQASLASRAARARDSAMPSVRRSMLFRAMLTEPRAAK